MRKLTKTQVRKEFKKSLNTAEGAGWLIHEKTCNLAHPVYETLIMRRVCNVYAVEKREETSHACKLEAGIGIIVEGFENGKY